LFLLFFSAYPYLKISRQCKSRHMTGLVALPSSLLTDEHMKKLIQTTQLAGVALVLSACGGSPQETKSNAPARLTQREAALTIVPLDNTLRISAGNQFSVGLHTNGNVVAWGENLFNQLGTGTYLNASTPVAVPGLSGIRAINAGGNHTLALHGNGTVFAFGNNSFNQFGNGNNPVFSHRPYQVPGMSRVQAVAAGQAHSVALTSSGNVWGWGRTTVAFSSTPLRMSALSSVRALSAGWDHDLALLGNGRVMAWGANGAAQLGLGDTVSTNTPTPVPGLSNIRAVAGGKLHSMALTHSGTVFAWGSNSYLQLGNSNNSNAVFKTPVQIPGLTNVKAIAAGPFNSAALLADGTIKVWGNNGWGQLGNGGYANSPTPITLAVVRDAVGLSYGNGHLLALKRDGSVYAVGYNLAGQLGNHTTSNSSIAVQTTGVGGFGYLNLGFAP
jgi:alpha-tubulin suppressor-like RCC1 family protein